MKKNIIIILSVLVLAVLIRFIFSNSSQWMMLLKPNKHNAPAVTIGTVQEENVILEFEAPARIDAKYQVDIIARINGYLTKSFFQEGDYVEKGQVLFEIEPKGWQLAANKAKAGLDQSKAQLIYAEKQLIRAKELVSKDYISKAQYDKILSDRDTYRAQTAMYTNEYKDALRNLDYTKVKAPVNGIIGMIKVTVGNYVDTPVGALATINSNDPIYVTFPINAKDFTELVKVDKTAYVKRDVDLFFSDGTKYEYNGIQDFHDNKVDETTGTITMRATFPNPKGILIHGNYATIRVYSKEKEGVPVVPQIATMENPQGKFVYKLDENGIPQVQTIQTVSQFDNNWVVKSGLKKGDRIILKGIQNVVPGNPVREVSEAEIQKVNLKSEEKSLKKQE